MIPWMPNMLQASCCYTGKLFSGTCGTEHTFEAGSEFVSRPEEIWHFDTIWAEVMSWRIKNRVGFLLLFLLHFLRYACKPWWFLHHYARATPELCEYHNRLPTGDLQSCAERNARKPACRFLPSRPLLLWLFGHEPHEDDNVETHPSQGHVLVVLRERTIAKWIPLALSDTFFPGSWLKTRRNNFGRDPGRAILSEIQIASEFRGESI